MREELVKRFGPRTTLATLLASAAGFASAHLLLHPSAAADFRVPALSDRTLAQAPLVIVVGVTSGLLGQGTIAAVTGLLVLRFVLGVVSYAACTPGGLFAPMLVLGSHLGLLVGLVGHAVAPHQTPEPPWH